MNGPSGASLNAVVNSGGQENGCPRTSAMFLGVMLPIWPLVLSVATTQ